jgi:hypothetical protein
VRKQNEIQTICHRRLAGPSPQSNAGNFCDIVYRPLLHGDNLMNIKAFDIYIYTPATTNITIRWKAHGWIPPTEDPEFQRKWAEFRSKTAAGIEALMLQSNLSEEINHDQSRLQSY